MKSTKMLKELIGTPRVILLYTILTITLLVPLIYINLPWWANILIIFAVWSFRVLGALILVASWIWSFFIMVNLPFNLLTVFYIIGFILYLFSFYIPKIMMDGALKRQASSLDKNA